MPCALSYTWCPMPDPVFEAFSRELEKLGIGAQLAQLGQNLGRRALSGGGLAALGGAGGAAVGAVGGGIQGYRNREEGVPGAAGALQGAMRGAAIGGGAGAALGGVGGMAGGKRVQDFVSGLARPGAARPGTLGSITRFGQRQAHSLTGALPEGYASRSAALESIGGGAAPVRRAMQSAQEQVAAHGMTPKLQGRIEKLQKGIAAGERSTDLGMTSVPGFFKAMVTNPREALTEGAKSQWYSNPTALDKTLALGLPGAMVAGEALRDSKPGEESRGVRSAKALFESIPYSLGPMPLAGATVAAGALRGATGLASKPFQRNQWSRKPGPPVPEDGGVSQSVEHVYSPAAQGVYPEGVGV